MFRFQHDVTVVPRDSAWFGFYNGTQLLTMQETALYQVRAGLCTGRCGCASGSGCACDVLCCLPRERMHTGCPIWRWALDGGGLILEVSVKCMVAGRLDRAEEAGSGWQIEFQGNTWRTHALFTGLVRSTTSTPLLGCLGSGYEPCLRGEKTFCDR